MAGIERRDKHNPRVRLGGLPVELVEDDLPGGFEADAHDLGVGGVGVRSAFLPKLGSRLHLRLISPADGSPIEASGEVVWRDDAGPHEGAFGLRFDAMDGASAEELARLLEGQMSAADGPAIPAIEAIRIEEPDEAHPLHEDLSERSGDAEEVMNEHVELYLDGVGDSLDALLVHDGGDLVTLEQSLDFLTLGRGAALGDGRRGEIASIELRTEGGLPRLAITLSFVPEEALSVGESEEDEFHEASHIFAKELRTSSAGELEAVVEPLFEPAAYEPERSGVESEDGFFEDAQQTYDAFPYQADEPSSEAAEREVSRDEVFDEPVEEAFFNQAPYQGTWVERPNSHPADGEDPSGALLELRRFAVRAKLSASEQYQRARPHLARFFTKARARSARLFGETLSAIFLFIRSIALRSKHFVHAFLGRLLDRPDAAELAANAPPNRLRKQQGAPDVSLESRKKSRTQLIIGLGVLLALIAAIGWMVGGGEEAGEVASSTEATMDGATAAADSPRGALPAAAAGQGFVDSSVAYGADSIPDAMIFELTLEGEPLTIRGEKAGDSVRVHIPEARALSRAGVIAANHPDIEYAAIRNLEDGAELELRFVPGREPAYRVELRGLVLRVSLAP